MNQDREYSNMARRLLKKAYQIDWSVWDSESEELTRDVSAAVSFVFHLSCLDTQLLELHRVKMGMQEMRFEDYVMDQQIVDYLKMLRRRWGRFQNIILTYTNRMSNDSAKDDELKLVESLDSCGDEQVVKDAGKFVQDFCRARLLAYGAFQQLLQHYRGIAMDSMIHIVREGKEFALLCKRKYESWLQQNRPSIERRLKNGLYKSSMYGKTIIPLQSTPPSREHWGEALAFKMQQIRADNIYSFIDDDEFHEVGVPIKLTGKLLIKALSSIKQCVPSDSVGSFSYDKQMEVFYGHIAEINILKEKISLSCVPAGQDALKDEEMSALGMTKGKHDVRAVYPAMPLLEYLVRDAIEKKKKPKYILLPVRAAMDAGVLIPIHNVKDMNEHFKDDLKGAMLTKQCWSLWVDGVNRLEYDSRELNPIKHKFKEYVQSPTLQSLDGIVRDIP